jgi:hypothetical protein
MKKIITIKQLEAAVLVYKRVGSLQIVADMWGMSAPTVKNLFIRNGVIVNSTHPVHKKFPYSLREEIKKDIIAQMNYNKTINYKNLFSDSFIQWLNDKYETTFKRTYLYQLKNEIVK